MSVREVYLPRQMLRVRCPANGRQRTGRAAGRREKNGPLAAAATGTGTARYVRNTGRPHVTAVVIRCVCERRSRHLRARQRTSRGYRNARANAFYLLAGPIFSSTLPPRRDSPELRRRLARWRARASSTAHERRDEVFVSTRSCFYIVSVYFFFSLSEKTWNPRADIVSIIMQRREKGGALGVTLGSEIKNQICTHVRSTHSAYDARAIELVLAVRVICR